MTQISRVSSSVEAAIGGLQVGAAIGSSIALSRAFGNKARLTLAVGMNLATTSVRLFSDLFWQEKNHATAWKNAFTLFTEGLVATLIPGRIAILGGALCAAAGEVTRQAWVNGETEAGALLGSGLISFGMGWGFGKFFHGAVTRIGQARDVRLTNRFLALYDEGGPELYNIENAAHVRRLLASADEFGDLFSPRQVRQMKLGMVGSDVGKNWKRTEGVLETLAGDAPIEMQRFLDKNQAESQRALLEGLVDWLRRSQRATGVRLQFQRPDLQKLAATDMEGAVFAGSYHNLEDSYRMFLPGEPVEAHEFQVARYFASRFLRPDSPVFPNLMALHEIPGHCLMYAKGAPKASLHTNVGHNGPASEGSFWKTLWHDMMGFESPYPLPGVNGKKFYIDDDVFFDPDLPQAHTLFDRYDQGLAFATPKKSGGTTLMGGVRKIFAQEVERGRSPQEVAYELFLSPHNPAIHALSGHEHSLVQQSIKQMRAIPIEREGLKRVRETLVGRLQEVDQRIARGIDFERITPETFTMADGTVIKTGDLSKLSASNRSAATARIVDDIFTNLAQYFT